MKVDNLCHQPPPSPTLPAPTTVELAAHDFEHAHITSLGGGTASYNQDTGPSRVAPPPAALHSSSPWGRAQAKPALQVEPVVLKKGKEKEPQEGDQAAPECGLAVMEDEITSTEIYDDIPMVINTAVWGTLFPEFTGNKVLFRVLCLRQGKDSVRMILFVRVNDNLYAYSDKRLSAALANICQGTPPPLPIREYPISTDHIAAYEAHPFATEEIHILQGFATVVLLYDLPHCSGVEGRSSEEKTPVQNEEPEEGEMRDKPAPM
ncbi:hypothetical protein EDD17DRAFT_1764160 [Pisolithus thermaeus]|nr:hypothetical protein EDD17DRAFT_1764160 [Pisolithus thermaeus]